MDSTSENTNPIKPSDHLLDVPQEDREIWRAASSTEIGTAIIVQLRSILVELKAINTKLDEAKPLLDKGKALAENPITKFLTKSRE